MVPLSILTCRSCRHCTSFKRDTTPTGVCLSSVIHNSLSSQIVFFIIAESGMYRQHVLLTVKVYMKPWRSSVLIPKNSRKGNSNTKVPQSNKQNNNRRNTRYHFPDVLVTSGTSLFYHSTISLCFTTLQLCAFYILMSFSKNRPTF